MYHLPAAPAAELNLKKAGSDEINVFGKSFPGPDDGFFRLL
jgi:hypothetical protein